AEPSSCLFKYKSWCWTLSAVPLDCEIHLPVHNKITSACPGQRGENSSLNFLYSEFPGEPLRLCSSSGSNLQGGSRSPFWGGFLAVLASPAGGSHVPGWCGRCVWALSPCLWLALGILWE
uniref:Uncharacterized protein n=1 Tax=Catharus ustulatus TaxID=91951 RepID=A0A8C3URC7_CATUS